MRTVRNITVAVDPDLYHQTRKVAAEYNTTVTEMVRYLLLILPEAVKAARFPGGCPQFGLAVARGARAYSAVPPSAPAPLPSAPNPTPEKREVSPSTPVNVNHPVSIQPLAEQGSAIIQDKYFSISALKTIISKALRAIR
jgi:hypothetical protein